jgi:hypothetical protein
MARRFWTASSDWRRPGPVDGGGRLWHPWDVAPYSRKRYRYATVAAVFVVAAAIAYFLFEGSRLQETVVAVTAVVGALAMWFQMKRSKDMAEGEFILTLNTSFSKTKDIRELYTKLASGRPLTEADRTAVVQYMTFFETMYLLIDRDVVDMKLLDDLFRYRFYIAVTNPQIQEMELIPDAPYYCNIYTLDHLWTKHRERLGEPVDSPTALSLANPRYFDFVKVKRRGKPR